MRDIRIEVRNRHQRQLRAERAGQADGVVETRSDRPSGSMGTNIPVHGRDPLARAI